MTTSSTSSTTILPPSSSRLNQHIDLLAHLLDDYFRIPGTSVRFGIAGVIGLIPGVGDVLGGVVSCVIVLAAWLNGVPNVTIARMVANVAIEVVIGMVPFVGDVFDIAFKANRRNYALLSGSLQMVPRNTTRDWLFFAAIGLFMLALTMIPVFLMAKLVSMMVLAGMHR